MGRFDDLGLKAVQLGKDHLLVITGGTAHIGAASMAYTEADERIVTAQTAAVPGHKEHRLTDLLVRKISRELGITALLVMGIHYDGLDPEEIREISIQTERMIDEYIAGVKGVNP
ncbi:hypothetical protein [Paenibacillus physcomitrellae]|uniref:Prenylated flavin chaperone LpdD-like domain-containing protein n=1 Tax=Paenibacillus physcomitrellae TaxID=1619311 RepID=A0ABQ1FQQ1_9BACL|nr:hypothetical protein [Paenibacillus physcomitrellae]GGA25296.1 hypothetical protein GCM10010917_07780 [Paenibacillus physcomitrellae]